MEAYIKSLETELSLIKNGFKEEERRALADYKFNNHKYIKKLAFLAYKSDNYQVRMYGVFLFGYLSEQKDILLFMRDEVSKDDNWRVQEVLAKAFDEFCHKTGYEKVLPIIDEWLKFPESIKVELNSWKLESKEIIQVYKLASKFIS